MSPYMYDPYWQHFNPAMYTPMPSDPTMMRHDPVYGPDPSQFYGMQGCFSPIWSPGSPTFGRLFEFPPRMPPVMHQSPAKTSDMRRATLTMRHAAMSKGSAPVPCDQPTTPAAAAPTQPTPSVKPIATPAVYFDDIEAASDDDSISGEVDYINDIILQLDESSDSARDSVNFSRQSNSTSDSGISD